MWKYQFPDWFRQGTGCHCPDAVTGEYCICLHHSLLWKIGNLQEAVWHIDIAHHPVQTHQSLYLLYPLLTGRNNLHLLLSLNQALSPGQAFLHLTDSKVHCGQPELP